MYFPYLRGRQFELIAIRELSEQEKLYNTVIPIIEPVKLSSTLSSTISTCQEKGNKIAVMMNPQVGSLLTDAKKDKTGKKLNELRSLIIESDIAIKAIIASKDSKETLRELNDAGINTSDILVIYQNRDYIDDYDEVFERKEKYNVVPYDSSFRRIRGKRILIADRFNAVKKERNSDYADKPDEFFSDDQVFYTEDGYIGFSDFSIVGQDYQETGFAPYAVAIHIVYFDDSKNLRIHHFVSDSNDDINDPANKFYEAVTKLVKWNEEKELDTIGLKKFEELYHTGAYPGLGVVKKLSIMHHLELVGKYLEEKEK